MPTVNSIMDKLTDKTSRKAFGTLDLQKQREAKVGAHEPSFEPKEPEADWRIAMWRLKRTT